MYSSRPAFYDGISKNYQGYGMSFTGFSDQIDAATVVENTSFWPQINLSAFQETYRLPGEYRQEMLIDRVMLAMVWANTELSVFQIDRCPAKVAPLLLAGLVVWLSENAPNRDERDLDDPDVDVTLGDDQTVFVQITVEFNEPVAIVPDESGLIEWEGQTWGVADVPVYVATSGTVAKG